MKNKSTRHKSLNTFKFLPFSERIANIDVDVFHKVPHKYEAQYEESLSYFHQTIDKWDVLNLSEGYEAFCKEVQCNTIITLPQLLHMKEHVIDTLLKHLELKDPLYLQPLLELLVALAKDLQKEFYPYYKQFLNVLIQLLNTKDADQLEWTFTCLAYIFKFLWRQLVKDINNVFNTVLPLLSDSKPEYINNFAAESFAFVARKVKDRRSFLALLLRTVEHHSDGIVGCAKLLFQVLSGTDGQFHSYAETLLPLLFESLSDEELPQNALYAILTHVVSDILNHIQPQKGELFWNTCLNKIHVLYEKYNSTKDQEVIKNLDLLMKLVEQAVEYKSGRFLTKLVDVIQFLCELLSDTSLPEFFILTVSRIAVLILISRNLRLTQEQASLLTRKLLSIKYEAVLLRFVDHISPYSGFEALILPFFLSYCSQNASGEPLQVLSKIILKKAPLCSSGINFYKWKKYNLDFKESNSVMLDVLTKNIHMTDLDVADCFDSYVCSLICLTHLKTHLKQGIVDILLKNVKYFSGLLKSSEIGIIQKSLFLLNTTLECIIHLKGANTLKQLFMEDLLDKLLPLVSNPDYILSLKTLSLCFTAFNACSDVINMISLKKITQYLEKNFSSPYHEVRLLTSHIYTNFETLEEFEINYSTGSDALSEQWKVFSICYEVESIDPQVDTYRDQLQRLEKLSFETPQMIMCHQTEYKLIPMRYLCGTLYINFRLLWDPVVKILATHAHGMSFQEFWDVFGAELKGVCENIENKMESHVAVIQSKYGYLNELYLESFKLKSKPDFINYRILLWKALSLFPNLAEARTRDISDMLLNFMRKEYVKFNVEGAASCSIKQRSSESEVEDMEQEETKKLPKEFYLSKKCALRTLLQKLSVFSQIKSPLSMYREPELKLLYLELVQNRDRSIQKAALDCIMTYKDKSLTPYKENLYNLIDDNAFKNEIRSFRIDKESDVVQTEHRAVLIPLVMQIVLSKMNAKIGLRTGGKSSGQLKRSQIVRFLAGCEEEEILIFLHKALKLYSAHLEDDPVEMVHNVSRTINLDNFLSPKKLQSTVNLLNVIFEQCGGLLGVKALQLLLKILLIIGTFLKVAYDNTDQVHGGYSAILRNIRTTSIKLITHFFQHFERYPWTSNEINAVFLVFVWPYIDKLNMEGIHSPTALLKLFVQWGSNPRYFPLLIKCKEDEGQYVLQHVIKLFCNEKANVSVVNAIEEMLEKLLLLEEHEEESHLKLTVHNLQPLESGILEKIGTVDKLNYGSCILLPHVPAVLEKMKRKLNSKTKNLNTKELFILSRVSELVWEASLSDSILNLLLPIVLKKASSSEDIVLKYTETLLNLVKNVTKPEVHLKEISPLFGQITYTSCRKVLLDILNVISGKTEVEELKNIAEVISKLNAYDQRWVDQPDFERRHDAFKAVEEMRAEKKLSLALGIVIIHNCFYFMKNEKDLSLRENSNYSLKGISVYLLKTYPKQNDYIINDTLFTLIRATLKHREDEVRNETIQLLGHLARESPEAHFILRDLNYFTSKADLEVDFFENLVHLQIHRHARALLKFSQITKELTTSLNTRTLTQFLLPLASHYLCNDKYVSKNSVIDSAIEAIGTICRILPWHQYEGLLKYYLDSLSGNLVYQRQLVRLTVAILDSFHFDLSKGTLVKIEEKDEDKKEESAVTAVDKGFEEVTLVDKEDENNAKEICQIEDNNEAEDEEDDLEETGMRMVYRTSVLCKSTATRAMRSIQFILLPKLHKTLAELTHHDVSHKVNRKKLSIQKEEEDLLKVPISLAVVKLLQRLPVEIMDANLPGVFTKTCTFLKSHLDSVRKVARETLQKIMLALGPKYLRLLLAEMAPLLNRGFQVHVLVFTIHGVLNCLKDMYQIGDVDEILLTVLNFCATDLFGVLSEEREVAKITVKTSEARSTKTYDTLQILAQFITESCFLDLILPIKQVLETTHAFKTVSKAQNALRFIALGLVENAFISVESLLKFAYGIVSESIPQLLPKMKKTVIEKEKIQRQKEDCFIVPKIPNNRKSYREQNVKMASNTNAHVLVEFGLRLCLVLLKRDKVKDTHYKKFLDPFVKVIKDCLKSKQVKLCSLTLQCLTYMFKYELPSLKSSMKSISRDIMDILHKYGSAGLSKGDNFDLVISAFKCMTVLVKDAKYHIIDAHQLKILLMYAEQDIHDHERQATAFSLLRAIIGRKLNASEMNVVMTKVAELSIISELEHVRAQSRSVFYQYIMDYPLGKALEKHLGFYLSQMSYEVKYGRQSAIEMVQTFINSFPLKVLIQHSGTFLITLGARLVNDDEPECRKAVAGCITSMLQRIPKEDYEPLFEIVAAWFKDSNLNHRRLAAQLCSIFVNVEKSAFESRISSIAPLILKQFGLNSGPGRFVKVQKEGEKMLQSEEYQYMKDHHLFQVLQLLLKLCANCPAFLKNCDLVGNLAVHVQTLLSYPHEWVRLAAAQFLGFVLSTINTDRLAQLLRQNEIDDGMYLYSDPENALKSLTLDLCDQLQPGVKNDLAEQVVKNLIFVARTLQHIALKPSDSETKLNMFWLAKRMRKIVNSEVVENPSVIVLRTEVFKWIAGVITALDIDKVRPVLDHLMAPLVRELITTEEKNAPLRQLAKEVTNMLKKKIGVDEYTNRLLKLQQKLGVKRAERKRARMQLAVTEPEVYAKKKIRRQEKKKEAKKRKLAVMKGKKVFKKRKVVEVDLDNSEVL